MTSSTGPKSVLTQTQTLTLALTLTLSITLMLSLTLTDFRSSAVLRQTADTEHVHVLLDSLISMHLIFLVSR